MEQKTKFNSVYYPRILLLSSNLKYEFVEPRMEYENSDLGSDYSKIEISSIFVLLLNRVSPNWRRQRVCWVIEKREHHNNK